MKQTVLPVALSGLLALFLSVVTVAGALFYIAGESLCEPTYLMQTAQDSGYTQELYGQIAYKWENLLAITGIQDQEPVMAVLTPEEVAQDALLFLETAYEGSAELDLQQLSVDLETKVREYVDKNYPSAQQQAELEKNILDLVNACISDYRSAVSIPGAGTVLRTLNKIRQYVKPGMYITAGAALVFLVLLFFLQRKRRETLYYTAIALTADSLILLGVPALIYGNRVIERLPLGASAMKTLIDAFLIGILDRMHSAGLLFLLTALLLLLVYGLIYAIFRMKK